MARDSNISQILIDNNARTLGQQPRKVNLNLNEHYFDCIDSEDKAYFLGLLLADGSVEWSNNRQSSLRLELVETDKYILDLLSKHLNIGANMRYEKREGRKNGTFTLFVRSNILCDALAKYGVVPNKTNTLKALPDIPSKYLPDMIRGLIDGDGSIYFDRMWHINFTGLNYEWVYSFMDTVRRMINKKNIIHPTVYNGIHKIIFNGRDVPMIIEKVGYLDSDYTIPRKRSLAIRAFHEN